MYTTNNTSGKLGKGWAWGRGGESGGQSKQILKNELGMVGEGRPLQQKREKVT